jgi:hypothetical protein
MNAFDLFWMTNEESSVMKTPYRRSTFFLGLLQGPKVEDWVVDQAQELCSKVTRRSNPIDKTEEVLWDDLKQAFINAYAHTGHVEITQTDLAKLMMVGDQIDEYIAKFENLLKCAEIPHTEVGAIEKFRNGLQKGVAGAVLKCDIWPTTIDEWEENARREVRRYAIMKEAMGGKSNPFTTEQHAKWYNEAKKVFSCKKNEPIPMEIDAARTKGQAKERLKNNGDVRLKNEGCCYGCQ